MRIKQSLHKFVATAMVTALVAPATMSTALALPLLFFADLSPQQEIELGRQAAAQVEREKPILRDRGINNYVQSLGNKLARNSGREIPFRFRVINERDANAFALPGGFIYVHRGIIELSRNESELAGVLAHEIAHVSERHIVEQMRKAQGLGLGLGILDMILGRSRNMGEQIGALVANLTAQGVFMKFSRDAEREADREAVQILRRSGINPQGMVTLFQRMEALRRQNPGLVGGFFSSHPSLGERQENISGLLRSSDSRLRTNSSSFSQVRNRLT
ncbi:MAG: M48 family metallopeptidase [Acidobacteriota bacterium]